MSAVNGIKTCQLTAPVLSLCAITMTYKQVVLIVVKSPEEMLQSCCSKVFSPLVEMSFELLKKEKFSE